MDMQLAMDQTGCGPADAGFGTEASRWAAVIRRAPEADGHFLYSVATTGVYCHPSCAARQARRENVAFHNSRAEAERAGFRPCKRCRPDLPPRGEREAALIAAACRTIDTAEEPPALADLAAAAGLSPHHFHRTFKRIAGVTPRAYAAARRQERVQESLEVGTGVAESLYGAGFNSSGRFYEAVPDMLGMTPTAYRKGGAGETIRFATGRSSLGHVLVAATALGVCAIMLGDDPAGLGAALARRFPKAILVGADGDFASLVADIVRMVDDPANAQTAALPTDIRGTVFQRQVWERLREIPPGETATYAQIAARVGKPAAVRAVANACGANPLAVAIPCHRVVASNGGLGGYRWGVERKRRLLAREQN